MQNKTYILKNGIWEEIVNLNKNIALPQLCTPNREYIVMLDCGRKYFTPSWIKSLIDYMSELGYNSLQLHFSEEMGFRIESKLYPWLAGSSIKLCVRKLGQIDIDEGKYLTQKEVLDICCYAKTKSIEIIPSFDSPGHIDYILTKYEEHYGKNNTIRNYYHPRQTTIDKMGDLYNQPISNNSMDLSNESARSFMKSLIYEMANLFRMGGCTKFDIGGDELLAVGKPIPSGDSRWLELLHWDDYAVKKLGTNAVAMDLYVDWMNTLNRMLKNLGFTNVRMWNDVYGIEGSTKTNWKKVVTLDKDIEFLWWVANPASSLSLSDAINSGFKLINCVQNNNYFVLTPNYIQPTVNSYLEHDSTNFGNASINYMDSAVKGTMFCIWCDNPVQMSETEIYNAIIPLIRSKIQKKEK